MNCRPAGDVHAGLAESGLSGTAAPADVATHSPRSALVHAGVNHVCCSVDMTRLQHMHVAQHTQNHMCLLVLQEAHILQLNPLHACRTDKMLLHTPEDVNGVSAR